MSRLTIPATIPGSKGEWTVFEDLLAKPKEDGTWRHVLTTGPPGTGKTHAGLNFGVGARRSVRFQALPGATHYDIFGQVGIHNGSTAFELGEVCKCIEDPSGARVVIDEADNASEDLSTALYSLMDGHPFTIPNNGYTIVPGKGLQFVLTTNVTTPEHVFREGILDRVYHAPITTPHAEILKRFPAKARPIIARCVQHGITGTRAWMRFLELEASMPKTASTRLAVAAFGTHGPDVVAAYRVALSDESAAFEYDSDDCDFMESARCSEDDCPAHKCAECGDPLCTTHGTCHDCDSMKEGE